MAYWDVAQLQADPDFRDRVTACYATEHTESSEAFSWTQVHIWQMAGAPGFGDAYAAAILNEVPNPGRDPSVIPDVDILAALQAIHDEPPP
jgi:hypothetical protein